MHVFCPDCNAEYKVNERSSLTKTVKFVCIECGSSWMDKFEKLEQTTKVVSATQETISDEVNKTTKKELTTMELNSLAFEEVQYSFGSHKNSVESKNNNTEREHTFQFETSEVKNDVEDEGPSKTFPKIRRDKEPSIDDQVEERDVKEIEIEKRLKESSELLKKAKQPLIENREPKEKEKKPKRRNVLLTLSVLLVISFFTYNFTVLFFEEIQREVPFAREIFSHISSYTDSFRNTVFIIIETIMNFIPNLA